MKTERIPLFPLELVLFPGTPLPLHIFEPRYKQMISLCIEQQSEFAVLLVEGGDMARVGCTAEVIKIVERYPDGRMDILTQGQRPCRILDVIDEKPYNEAMVEYLKETAADFPPETPARLIAAFQRCHQSIYHRQLDMDEAAREAPLSYHLTSELPIALTVKQELLELRSEAERRARLFAHLEEWAPRLERAERLRVKSAGNGHSHD
jgi:ATP-dependent Lon protease